MNSFHRAGNPLDRAQPVVESALTGLDQDMPNPGLAIGGKACAERAVVLAVPAVTQRDREPWFRPLFAQPPNDWGARLDGWHGSRLSPEAAAPSVRRLREKRPEPGFTISLRSGWDGQDDGELGARLAAYGAAGVGHVLVEPAERALDNWLRAVERVARVAEGDLR